jgi:hypothetical protein
MYCSKCGQELIQGQHFCPGCGASVPGQKDSVPPPSPARPSVEAAEPTESLSAKKEAKISNLFAIPGFLLFIAGLVLLGAGYVKQTPESGMPGWGCGGGIFLVIGACLLIVALVFSILHWRDMARAHAQKQAGQVPPSAGPGTAVTAPLPVAEPGEGMPATERPDICPELSCAGCGHKLEPREHFCANCGAKAPG